MTQNYAHIADSANFQGGQKADTGVDKLRTIIFISTSKCMVN